MWLIVDLLFFLPWKALLFSNVNFFYAFKEATLISKGLRFISQKVLKLQFFSTLKKMFF